VLKKEEVRRRLDEEEIGIVVNLRSFGDISFPSFF